MWQLGRHWSILPFRNEAWVWAELNCRVVSSVMGAGRDYKSWEAPEDTTNLSLQQRPHSELIHSFSLFHILLSTQRSSHSL